MFSKSKPTKQELKKLDHGMTAIEALVDLINGLEKAIETQGKAVEFLDAAIRRELARTQLTIGLSRAHLRQLAQAAKSYLADQKQAGQKQTGEKTAGAQKAGAKKAAAKKPAKSPAKPVKSTKKPVPRKKAR